MPAAIGAIAAAAPIAFGTSTFFGISGMAGALLAGVSSLALSGLQAALAPKPKGSAAQADAGITQNVKQAITYRGAIHGEARVAGNYTFIGSTESNSKLHFITPLASHEVQEIGEVWLGDESITPDMLDANGFVTSGTFAGKVRIIKHLGSPLQGADSVLMSECAEWTTRHKMQEVAYLYVRFEYDRTAFASGLPTISAWVKGKKVRDPRDGVTRWSPNSALVAQDILTMGLPFFRKAVPLTSIDENYTITAANKSDEMVQVAALTHTVTGVATATDLISVDGNVLQFQTGDRVQVSSTGTLPSPISAATNYYVIVYQRIGTARIKLATSYANALAGTGIDITTSGSGTITIVKNAEPRYTANGRFTADESRDTVLKAVLASMAGKHIYAGGKHRLRAGSYVTPTLVFDEDDFAGGFTIKTSTSMAERFNRVIGQYTSPINNGQPQSYPMVKNDTYAAADGEPIEATQDQRYASRPSQCQRLAKILIERARQDIIIKSRFKLSAFATEIGDNISLNISRYGFSAKPFEVIDWGFAVEGSDGSDPQVYIEMTLQETASTCWDWAMGEETSVDPAPNTNLPKVKIVEAPSGLRFDSYPVQTLNGDKVFGMVLTWDAHPNAYVLEGGGFEIQYKLSTETDYRPSFFVTGRMTKSELTQASVGVAYDLRIRAVNNLNAVSGWQTLSGIVAGSSGGVTATDDYGAFVGDAVTATDDYGAFVGDAVSSSDDYGGFV